MSVRTNLGWVSVVIAILLQSIGGFMDILQVDRFIVSREHVFVDALFLLVLGFGLIDINRYN